MSEATSSPEGEEEFRIGGIGRHSLIYAIGQLATKSVGFIMLPIYARLLTPADYGVIQLIVMTFEMATIFTAARLSWGVFRFYHKATDEEGRRAVLSTAGALVAVTYAVVAAAIYATAGQVAGIVFGVQEGFDTFVRIAAIGMAFEGLILVPMAIFQVEVQSKTFVAVSLAKLGFTVVLNLLFLIPFSMGVTGVLLSSMIANVAIGTVLTGRLIRYAGIRLSLGPARDLIRFGAPLMVMQLAAFILTFGDRYFLNQAGNMTAVGLYGLAYQFGLLVATIGYMPFGRVWDPQRFAVAQRSDRDEICARVFVYLNALLMPMALGVGMFAGDAIRIMATSPFHPAAAFVPVLAGAYVFQCWGSFLNLGIFIKEKTEYFTLANWVAAGVALAGYLFLIPKWLAWGATFSTLASLATRAWLTHIFSQRLWPLKYRWRPIVQLGALTVVVGLLSFYLPPLPLVASIATHAGLFLIYLTVAWLLPILTDEERQAVRSGWVQLRRLAASMV